MRPTDVVVIVVVFCLVFIIITGFDSVVGDALEL